MRRVLLLAAVSAALFLSACSLTLPTTAGITTTTSTGATTDQTTATQTTTTLPGGDEVDPLYQALFDNATYHKFTLYFSQENFDKLIYDMVNYEDEFGSYRDNTIQEVDIVYEDGDGTVIEEYEVGFRTRGNIFSRDLPVWHDQNGNVLYDGNGDYLGFNQVSFQLEFNDTFDYPENSTEYKALKERRLFDLEQLNFKFIRSYDTSIVTEIAAYELYRAAGLVAPDTSLTVVYWNIDGRVVPYGLFTIVEPIDDVFVKRYFGKNQDNTIGDLWKCVWQNGGPATLQELNAWDYDGLGQDRLGVSDYNLGYRMDYQLKTNKETSDWSSMLTFMRRLNDTNVVNYKNALGAILDVDSWLKTLAVAFLVGNPDDYRNDANNYYLYFYEGKAVYIPYDNDQCLGIGWNPFGDQSADLSYLVNMDIYYQRTAQSWFSYDDLPLVVNVLQYQDYQSIYENYLYQYTDPEDGIFDYLAFHTEFYTARSLYRDELNEESHLGVRNFSLEDRWKPESWMSRDMMTAEDYYTEKAAFVRASVEYHRTH